MGIGSRVLEGLAVCGAHGAGRGSPPPVVVLGGPVPAVRRPASDEPGPAPPGIGPSQADTLAPGTAAGASSLAVAACAAVCAVVTAVIVSSGHTSVRSSLRHLGVLLTGRSLRLAATDPFLVGGGLCLLAVLAFVLLIVGVFTPAASVAPVVRRTLVGGLRSYPRAGVRRAGRQGGRRGVHPRSGVARRPPTMEATRPESRPVARTREAGRTER